MSAADGEDVEAKVGILKVVASDVGLRGANDALAFAKTDGVFWRVGGLAGLHFDEDEDVGVPGDDVDFAVFGAIAGGDDAESKGTKVVDAEDFGTAAEGKETVEEEGKRHNGF